MIMYSLVTTAAAKPQKGRPTICGDEQWYNKCWCISIHAKNKYEPRLVSTKFIIPECRADGGRTLLLLANLRAVSHDHTCMIASIISVSATGIK